MARRPSGARREPARRPGLLDLGATVRETVEIRATEKHEGASAAPVPVAVVDHARSVAESADLDHDHLLELARR